MLRMSLLDASVVEATLAPLLLLLLLLLVVGGDVLLGTFGDGGAALFAAACSADTLLDAPLLLAPFLTPSLHQQHFLQLGTQKFCAFPGARSPHACSIDHV